MLRTSSALALLLATASLTGCSDNGPRGIIISQCVRDGGTEAVCTCQADELKKVVNPRAFEAVALAAQGLHEQAEKAIAQLPPEQRPGAEVLAATEHCGKPGS